MKLFVESLDSGTQKEVIILDAYRGEVSLVSVQGFPSACSTNKVQCFFFFLNEIQSGAVGIYLIYITKGRLNGKAFIKLDSVKLSLKKRKIWVTDMCEEIFKTNSI